MTRGKILVLIAVMAVAGDTRTGESALCELLKTRHLAIQVRINGHGPYRMIFDTGSPVVLISSRVAQDCQLFGGVAGKFALLWPGQATLESIECGDAKLKDVPAVILDHPTVKAIESAVGRIDGILGHSFFAHFKTTVDYSQKTITLTANNHKPKDALETLMASLTERDRKPPIIAPAAQWGLEVEKQTDDVSPGMVIRRVESGSAAATAKLREGDRLLTIDGQWTDSIEDCYRAVENLPANATYEISIVRNGTSMTLQITPKNGF